MAENIFWKMKIYKNTINVCRSVYQQGTKMCTMTLRLSNPKIPHPYSPKGSSGVPAVVSSSFLFDF